MNGNFSTASVVQSQSVVKYDQAGSKVVQKTSTGTQQTTEDKSLSNLKVENLNIGNLNDMSTQAEGKVNNTTQSNFSVKQFKQAPSMTASSVDDLVKYIENKSATKSSKKKKKIETSNIVSTDQS